MKRIILVALFLLTICAASTAHAYSGGNGSAATPYQIATPDDLLELAGDTLNYDKYFILTANINLTGRGDNPDGSFSTAPIAADTDNTTTGFEGTEFEGSFDGNGHTISNLTINTNGIANHYLGLFGMIQFSARVQDLDMENITIIGVEDSENVGGICGKNYYSDILNCNVAGSVTGGEKVGGICGDNYENITDCSASCSVQGYRDVGGICGDNYVLGDISGCSVTGDITGTFYYVGGICGFNRGDIDSCFVSGDVLGSANDSGVLCGDNFYGTITNSYATGNVTSNFWITSSLCETNYGIINKCYSVNTAICHKNWGGISDCYWDKDISQIASCAGGIPTSTSDMMKEATFIGWNDGSWKISEASSYPHLVWESKPGTVISTDYPAATYSGNGTSSPFQLANAGDIVSMTQRTCDWDKNFVLTNDIDMTSVVNFRPVTEFTGTLDGQGYVISNLTINGNDINIQYEIALLAYIGQGGLVINLGMENVTLTGGELVGGICGMNRSGTIDNCYVTGSITNGILSRVAGGLCGYNYSIITNCYADTDIVGDDNLGGLCGWSPGDISNSFATGDVTGRGHIGGLCGSNSGNITDCYANGDVTQAGTWPDKIGGFCGINWESISNCYSTGDVNGTEGDIGGFSGINWGSRSSIENCFWDTQTQTGTTSASVGSNPHGGTITNVFGKNTAEMQTQNTYTDYGWVFSEASGGQSGWKMPISGYPQLSWQYNPVEMEEFAELAKYWQRDGCTGTELCKKVDWFIDGLIDSRDLIQLAESWLGDEIIIFDPVNMVEFNLLAQYWQMTGCDNTQSCSAVDWYVDGAIDIHDLGQLAKSWMSGEIQIFISAPLDITESFETGDFTALSWQFGGDSNWAIVSDIFYQGIYAVKSGVISHTQSSTIEFTVDTANLDTISFARKISSEGSFDFLKFYIDGILKERFSGDLDWQIVEYAVSAGEHTFKWEYDKDFTVSSGSDCAWIDNIRIYDSP